MAKITGTPPTTVPTSAAEEDNSMSPAVYEQGSNIGPDIASALACEHLDADLYRSSKELWKPYSARGVFGGQVIGQAVTVSNASVDGSKFLLHSMHCYFLLAGDETRPIYYHVTRLRDGGSYVTRLIEAKQRGRCIFVLFSSYAKPEPTRPRFSVGLPRLVNNDESLTPSEEPSDASSSSSSSSAQAGSSSNSGSGGSSYSSNPIMHRSRFSAERAVGGSVSTGLIPYLDAPRNEERYERVLVELDAVLPEKVKMGLKAWIRDRQESAVEIRDALPNMYDDNGVPTVGHEQAFWIRVKSPIFGGDGPQKAALAYASDINLLGTVSKALGVSRRIKMMASLDHTMHFYEPFDLTQPILFFMQTQVSSNGRGLAIGRFYREDGTLLAMASQEGVVRAREDGGDNIARAMETKPSKL